MATDTMSKKYHIVINNPKEKDLEHEEIKRCLFSLKATAYFCMADEIATTGTYHTHIFVYFKNRVRFSTVQKLLPNANIQTAYGSPQSNRDYIKKEGRWLDDAKHETNLPETFEEWGELPAEFQGERSDLDDIGDMIDEGMTPSEIMAERFAYRRYERMIRSAYYDKRKRETPIKREVKVHYLVGESATGKSSTYVQLCEQYGEDNIFLLTDYDGGGFDTYNGESVLFMDEYKAQFPFATLLLILDNLKAQVHARYTNATALWSEVYITSVFPPEELYKKMVDSDLRGIDKQKQLFRRITDITYCYIDNVGEYKKYTIPMPQYVGYDRLKNEATEQPTPDWVREIEDEQAKIDELPL